MFKQHRKFLKRRRVVPANIVAIGAGALGIDVDNLEFDEEREQTPKGVLGSVGPRTSRTVADSLDTGG